MPKYIKLEMLPPTSTTLPPLSNGAVTQEIRLVNSQQGDKALAIKFKVAYSLGGQTVHADMHHAKVDSVVPNVYVLL